MNSRAGWESFLPLNPLDQLQPNTTIRISYDLVDRHLEALGEPFCNRDDVVGHARHNGDCVAVEQVS